MVTFPKALTQRIEARIRCNIKKAKTDKKKDEIPRYIFVPVFQEDLIHHDYDDKQLKQHSKKYGSYTAEDDVSTEHCSTCSMESISHSVTCR